MIVALQEKGYRVNHKKVWRMMKQLSIQSVIRKKRNRSSYKASVVYPNRLKREFHAIGPQQKMVTDIVLDTIDQWTKKRDVSGAVLHLFS